MFRIAMAFALASLLAPMTATPDHFPQSPQVRVSTRLVEIGVIVRDKNGPVSNLTQNDFIVLDRGKPQQISIFSADAAQPRRQPAGLPLSRNTFSDLPQYSVAAQPRSITIVLLDNLNTLYGSAPEPKEDAPSWVEDLALQNAKNHLLQFMQHLQPQDRIAIYGLRDSLHVVCDFTCDRDQLLAVVKKYDTTSVTNREIAEPGHSRFAGADAASMRMAGIANANRAAETMAALRQIAAHVANIPGRKNLVWLTANLPFSGVALARVLSPANIAVYPIDARGLLAWSLTTGGEFGTAAADDVSGASGHMDNMPAQSSQPIGIPTMDEIADQTGGQAFVNTNDITGAIRKAVEDSAVTYTLGFYISREALDGKFHEVKVKIRDKGLTVRYPKGYYAFPDTTPTENEDQLRLMTAVKSPIESSAIPVQLRIDRVEQPLPHYLSLFGSIDIRNLQLAQNPGVHQGVLNIVTVEQDETGRIVNQSGSRIDFRFTDQQYAAYLKSGFPFHQYIQPSPGVTTLRILVEDPSTSQLGSLIIPLSQIN